MTELSYFIARIGILIGLWVFIFLCVALIRRDIFGTYLRPRKNTAGATATDPVSLRVISGSLIGTVLPLSTVDITIGREAGSTLNFVDDFVSTHHARIFESKNRWYIEDLNSTNGTFINGKKTAKIVQLNVGDKIKIGRSTIRVES
jgi:pSer/pThr/pTyr-binding forkhead associated (FHA) protein